MKVRMRSQVKGSWLLIMNIKIWIKRDMNLEEREKEKVLRIETKEKKREKDRD
ncbi:hypothetical protein E2C01_023836 [Portunus trituberculatus]|uniref:Uncharacterized protein n=1 Tax=Portunus trituberculatus TaxID=210409 RepID=A0A5B7EB44_PORTR|nr:hypothetical protein [Portunus trituberculatus]